MWFATLASASSLLGGICAAVVILERRAQAKRHKTLKAHWQGDMSSRQNESHSFASFIIASLLRFEMRRLQSDVRILPAFMAQDNSKLSTQLRYAGLSEVGPSTVFLWRIRAVLIGAAALGLLGLLLSPLATVLGLIMGAAMGWLCLPWALRVCSEERTRALEQHLSQAIEVLCIGLRSGLSFERSLVLYCENFPTDLSAAFKRTQQVWHTGLKTRELALRELGQSYNSHLFIRMIDSIIRSLRFGSPLADSLEELAHEARRTHRTHVEEAVMKAPVKMMLPIGMLILPSMLLLVMGPFLLELLEGF
ncbi:MAG: type II secretion system F family protein [Eggerthellaceae bacterium]|nr:type II secretion system F family protein [Eggerthellaceae bacterium]